jgi:hypothetical protein
VETKKILVLGDESSGKKTALEHICSDLVITESASFGKTIMNNMKLHIFSPSGADRFKFMQEIMSVNIDGVIIFIDNTHGITPTSTRIINFVKEKNVPFVVFVNKQDLINESLLDISSKFTVISTSALSDECVNPGLNQLLEIMDSKGKKN